VGRDRQAHRGLAILLLADLTTILPRHTHRVTALLRIPRAVDDQGLDRFLALDRRQHTLAHPPQHRRARPGRLRHQMQQRLVLRRGALRRGHGRERFDALATLRRNQPDAVVFKWFDPVGVAEYRCQR
jgi:hypothetical protein